MGDSSSSSTQFLSKHWEGFKDFWGERLSFLDHYSKFIKRDKPLPSWSDADVEAFIAADPIHGPAVISFSFYSDICASIPCVDLCSCFGFWVFFGCFVDLFLFHIFGLLFLLHLGICYMLFLISILRCLSAGVVYFYWSRMVSCVCLCSSLLTSVCKFISQKIISKEATQL